MEDIAAEAEVGKGTLYRYFSDKDELYLALVERASSQYIERVREAVASTQGSRAQLEAVVEAIINFFDEQPHLCDLILRAEVLRDPDRVFPWQRGRDAVLQIMLNLFEEARENGELDIREPNLALLMLLGGLRAVVRFGARPRPANIAQHIVDLFLRGADQPAHSTASR